MVKTSHRLMQNRHTNTKNVPRFSTWTKTVQTKNRVNQLLPYRPLTFNFPPPPPQMPLSERTGAIFRGGDPSHSIPHPQKPLGGLHFHGDHGHGPGAKRQKHGWKVSKKSGTFNVFFLRFFSFFSPSKCYISAENDFRRLNSCSKCANKSKLVQHKTP